MGEKPLKLPSKNGKRMIHPEKMLGFAENFRQSQYMIYI